MTILKNAAFALLLILTSCASRKNVVTNQPVSNEIAMAGMAHNAIAPQKMNEEKEKASQPDYDAILINKETDVLVSEMPSTINAAKTTKKAASFSQMKEMVKNGELKMSKKDFKTLNKLDRLYKGSFKAEKSDPFEMTTIAKIIAIVGIISAIVLLFANNFFFLFLFMIAVAAFILRWVDVISF